MKTTFLTTLAVGSVVAVTAFAQETGPREQAYMPGDYTTTDGEELYQTLCAGCHMPNGEGAEGAGVYPALAGNPNLEFSAYAAHVIINGQAGMPSLGHLMDDAQIVELLTYLQTNLDNDYTPDATLQLVQDTRPFEPEEETAEHEVEVAEDDTADPEGTDPAAGMSPVTRHPNPGSNFPILMAVEVPADATLVYLSGTVPQVADDSAEQGSPDRFGDTKTQTETTLASIEEKLAQIDLTMADVIKMQVYLVAPDGSDAMDFGGFMEGYVQYFGTEDQPNLPTRSVFEVAGLANPLWLVEIEVVAVRP